MKIERLGACLIMRQMTRTKLNVPTLCKGSSSIAITLNLDFASVYPASQVTVHRGAAPVVSEDGHTSGQDWLGSGVEGVQGAERGREEGKER